MRKLQIILMFSIIILSFNFANAQSLYLEKGENATGIAISYQGNDGSDMGVISLGAAAKGIFDVGIFAGKFDGGYTMGVNSELFAIKETESIPFSFSFRSSFFLISKVTYNYYFYNSSGGVGRTSKTFFSVGASLSKKIPTSDLTAIYPTVFVTYQNAFRTSPYYEAIGGGAMLSIATTLSNRNMLVFESGFMTTDESTTVSIGMGYIFKQ